jgi:hypothetical protein
MTMALFKKAEMTSAFLKMGLLGFAGSGKTYTATKTAIGLVAHIRDAGLPLGNKPMFFLDTETGSDWVKSEIEASGTPLFTAKTRAFSDLMLALDEAERESSLLLVDSITHFWTELCESYQKARKRTRGLEFQDWAFLKKEWRRFTDRFINGNLHVIICGRAGYEYDYFEDDTGKKQLQKTGVKMRAETEFGYEPSLLVEMDRHTDLNSRIVTRTATILKDRSRLIDGKSFTNPGFKDFLPHIRFLNIGGAHIGVDTSRTSERDIPADGGRDKNRIYRRIVIDEIQSLLVEHFPGQTADEKRTKQALLREHFSASWTEIEELMSLPQLREGFDSLYRKLERKPSKYAVPEIDDEIPNFEADEARGQTKEQALQPLDSTGTKITSAAEPPSAAETPADHIPAGAPASSDPPPDDAGNNPDPLDEARALGRAACRRGDSIEAIPANIARYTRKRAAWEEGFADEGEKMEAEARQ